MKRLLNDDDIGPLFYATVFTAALTVGLALLMAAFGGVS